MSYPERYIEILRWKLERAIKLGDHAAEVMLVARIKAALARA